MPDKPNPKYVTFDLISGSDKEYKKVQAAASVKNPTVFDVVADNGGVVKDTNLMMGYVLNKLRAHVAKYGTMDELIFTAHGTSESLSNNHKGNAIQTGNMLIAMAQLEQELGTPIAKRVVFSACGTFSELSAGDIAWYRNYAREHNMEVVGTTSDQWSSSDGSTHLFGVFFEGPEAIFTGKMHIQRAVLFTPQGEVKRDKTDDRHNAWALTHNDRTWVDYHLGHTQDEAIHLIKKDMVVKASRVVATANAINAKPLGFEVYANSSLRYQATAGAEQIAKIDALNPDVGVVFSSDLQKAVAATSDNTVQGIGGVALHKMTEAERSEAIRNCKVLIKETGIYSNQELQKAVLEKNQLSQTDVKFTAVLLKDGLHALLVTEKGAYEVVDIGFGSHKPVQATILISDKEQKNLKNLPPR